MRRAAIVILTLFTLSIHSLFGQAGDKKDKAGTVQRELWRDIEVPAAPVLTPEEALQSFQIAPGFRVELAAAEPLVNDPVAMAWDADSRLYVVEMPAYMPDVDGTGEDEPIGRVIVLEDTDNDSAMDKSTVFIDKLVTPRALAIVKGGVLVAEPPNLWFCEDLDGDLVSDRKTKVADYAVTGSVEHSENGLMHGIDNWIYNAKSNRRFKWDGTQLKIEKTANRGQWGMSMDDYGRLFYTTNSNPALADFQPYEYSNRNPGHIAKAGITEHVASDSRVFSNRVNPGVNRGYRKATLRADYRLNTTTAVSGPAIYRGNTYHKNYYGNLFVTEPAGNAILRYSIEENDFGLKAVKRVENDPVWEKIDFLVSSDERFRPVDANTGPDGNLYILDMYRGILQHKTFVTTFLRKQILERKLENPTGLGRIYRIALDNDRRTERWPKLANKSDAKLVDALSDVNGWIRDTAQRLLVERGSLKTSALKRLRSVATSNKDLAAIHALWTLEGIGQLDDATLAKAIDSSSPWVRVHAIRAGETNLSAAQIDSSLFDAYERCFSDTAFRVRLQATQTLALIEDTFALEKIKRIFHPDLPNVYMEDAIVSALSTRELAFIRLVMDDSKWIQDASRGRIIGMLTGALFKKGNSSALFQLVAIAQDRYEENWKSKAIIAGLASAGNTPENKPIKLEEKPKAYYSFVETLSELPKEQTTGLKRVFSWPGKPSDDPLEGLTAEQLGSIKKGKEIYAATCMACHQTDGNGLPALAPPLNGSSWVNGSKERLALIVMHGISGPITVKGQKWNSVMPGHGMMPQFKGEGLAQTLNYIRTAWGNKSGWFSGKEIEPILERHKSRAVPWTVAELEKLEFAR